jgi:HSP20 family protein
MTLVKFNNRTRNSAPYFNNVFDSLFTEAMTKNHTITRMPAVNISEDEAAGLDKADFQLNVKKDTLSLWVEKKSAEGEEKKDYTRKEFDFNSFARSFMLPETVDAEKIAAEYTNGVLFITIGKKDESLNQPKTITVS